MMVWLTIGSIILGVITGMVIASFQLKMEDLSANQGLYQYQVNPKDAEISAGNPDE